MEFKTSELRGRIDRPSAENVWTLGDNNGNGTLDESESFGPRLAIDDLFLSKPGRGYLEVGEPPIVLGHIDSLDGLNGDFARGGFRDDLDDVNDVISPIGMGIAPDFPDIVQLPPPYQSIGIHSFAKHSGAHLMHVLRFEGDPEFTLSKTNETLEIGYGARFYAGLQDYRVYVSGGMMGEFKLDSSIESQALGPQVSIKWTVRNGPWQASAEAAAALTYMNIDGNQRGQIGEDLIPGRYNQGLYVSPSPIDNHLNEWDVSPALEAGLLASYDITPTTHCFIRGDAIQFGNVRDAEGAIIYSLPRMGLQDPGGHDVTVTAASIGIEIRR